MPKHLGTKRGKSYDVDSFVVNKISLLFLLLIKYIRNKDLAEISILCITKSGKETRWYIE